MIYPVFAAYARGLTGATPYLIGEALGIYGLTQGLLQIPFGLLSDRVGRKVMIVPACCCLRPAARWRPCRPRSAASLSAARCRARARSAR